MGTPQIKICSPDACYLTKYLSGKKYSESGAYSGINVRGRILIWFCRITPGDSYFDLRENIPLDLKLNHDQYFCKCDQKALHVDCRIDGNTDPPAILVLFRHVSYFLLYITVDYTNSIVCIGSNRVLVGKKIKNQSA